MLKAVQKVKGKTLKSANGAAMRVVGVCEVNLNLSHKHTAPVKFLVLDHLAAQCIIGHRQLKRWRSCLLFDENGDDVIYFRTFAEPGNPKLERGLKLKIQDVKTDDG